MLRSRAADWFWPGLGAGSLAVVFAGLLSIAYPCEEVCLMSGLEKTVSRAVSEAVFASSSERISSSSSFNDIASFGGLTAESFCLPAGLLTACTDSSSGLNSSASRGTYLGIGCLAAWSGA